jgi:CBS domain-containing protein
MKVSSLMTQDVITCRAADTLDVAAQQMWTYDIGSLPVVDDRGCIVGVLTDRDALMAAFTRGEPLHAISAGSTMSADPVTCAPDDELAAVEAQMGRRQIRRVPVVDGAGHPVGIVSMTDLARASQRRDEVSAAEVAATLAAVCVPSLTGGRP